MLFTLTGQAGSHWIGNGGRVSSWTNDLPADRIRLGVRDEGVYRVAAADIAAASGLSEGAARDALQTNGLALSCQGRPVRWMTDGTSLFFYGRATTELFAPENVYWLGFGAGLAMETSNAVPSEGCATNAWFMSAVGCRSAFVAPSDARDRRSSMATLTNVLNFGEWIQYGTEKTKTVVLPNFFPGAATGLIARVSAASFREFVSSDPHVCEVRVNGMSCGTNGWSNEQALTFDYVVPTSAVTSGTVQLTVRNAGAASQNADFVLLDATLIYPHAYLADTGMVLCVGGALPAVSAGGFASARVAAWSLASPEAPVALDAPVWQEGGGTWRTAFACGDASVKYAVFDADTGCFLPSVSGARDTDWRDPAEMPELAIIVPPRRWFSGFDAAVQPLAAFRKAQGLRTRVIDAEELYNAFSDGLVHPRVFQQFCAAGVTNEAGQTLRYLLFAGHAGTDYKLDAFKFGRDERWQTLFPLYLISQVETTLESPAALLLPSDLVLGDAVGGAVPEVAVGRFIATNAAELVGMVSKTIRYELTATYKNKAVFSSCSYDISKGDMAFSNVAVAASQDFVSAGWRPVYFCGPPNQTDNRSLWMNYVDATGILPEFQTGAGFYYYLGHSNDVVGGPSTREPDSVISAVKLKAATWSFPPVALLMGCRLGRWTALSFVGDQCVAEAGVRNRLSGFTAALSSAGYIKSEDARDFTYAFGERLAQGDVRLGDAWRGAFASVGDSMAFRLKHLVFLGDPALCIRATATARGTPSAWLLDKGLVNDPYADLSDQDSDGFATWLEYQAGTDPQSAAALRIRALAGAVPGASAVTLTFDALGGKGHRVQSTTNLLSGVWEPLPWREVTNALWSASDIPGDWPFKSVELPYDASEPQRFYRIDAE